ncbi:MAG: OB-fold domain-containing protein [Variovorax sp.]|nr:OB-fold domain-containing protein [Variovorax sp.]
MHPDLEFSAFLDQGRFMIQRSLDSGRHIFYPRVAEPGTGSTRLEWVEPSGRGTVYSVTIVNTRPPAEPYNVVLVDLDEGPRLMSRVDGMAAGDVAIGLRVEARVIRENGEPLLVFVPEGASA